MSIAAKKQKTLMKRRKLAIILSALLVVILLVAMVFVIDYAQTYEFEDTDGKTYYVRKRDGIYAMYDEDRQILSTDAEYGYYVTEIGTLVKVNAETGAHEVFAVVATEGQEAVNKNFRLLMFPHIESEDILSLVVHNSHGEYNFSRRNETGELDPKGSFVLDQSPLTTFEDEKFATLYVSAGYSLTVRKLVDPIKDENGEYSEYGLVPETRYETKDEKGEELETPKAYEYEPAYYVLTHANGTQHKVIIGDKLLTDGGYYAQYVDLSSGKEQKTDAVYVVDPYTGDSMTCPIEDIVVPTLTYPLKMNNYYDVEKFTIAQRKDTAVPGEDESYEKTLAFTYVDFSERENTLQATFPYEFELDMGGFTPAATSVDVALYSMYSPTFAEKGVVKLSPSSADLAKYGLYAEVLDKNGEPVRDEKGNIRYTPFSDFTISFNYDVTNEKNEYQSTLNHLILISKPEDEELNPDGNYFAYTFISEVTKREDGSEKITPLHTYDMIVELDRYSMEFLEWDKTAWVNAGYIQSNLIYVKDIELISPDYNAHFEMDNSKSEPNSDGALNSNYLEVTAKDSDGHDIRTFGVLKVKDIYGVTWTITASEMSVAKNGVAQKFRDGITYYGYNALGTQVLCKNGVINCKDYDVKVKEDTVQLVDNDDENVVLKEYVRYDTSLFRRFYQTLLYASIVDSYEPEDEAALLAQEPFVTLKVTTKDTDGTEETKTYCFYRISSRKAYITVNGNGGFYVYKNRVDKFITDAKRFFNYQDINPTGKT